MSDQVDPIGSDICECGDFRSQHAKGPCSVCHCQCSEFRFSNRAVAEGLRIWNKYHTPNRKALTSADIERLNAGNHRCDGKCGCSCTRVYDKDWNCFMTSLPRGHYVICRCKPVAPSAGAAPASEPPIDHNGNCMHPEPCPYHPRILEAVAVPQEPDAERILTARQWWKKNARNYGLQGWTVRDLDAVDAFAKEALASSSARVGELERELKRRDAETADSIATIASTMGKLKTDYESAQHYASDWVTQGWGRVNGTWVELGQSATVTAAADAVHPELGIHDVAAKLNELEQWKESATVTLRAWSSVIDYLQEHFTTAELGKTWQDAVLRMLAQLTLARDTLEKWASASNDPSPTQMEQWILRMFREFAALLDKLKPAADQKEERKEAQ
jgi:hypothetical protein